MILTIGDELLSGQRLDRNATWLASRLTELGLNVAAHWTLRDDLEQITSAFQEARTRARFIIITGGLGSTEDDLIREALAAALGVPLVLNQDASAQIDAFYAQWGRTAPPPDDKQRKAPRGCRILRNPTGIAPALAFESDEANFFISLPGVPSEVASIWKDSVEALLRSKSSARVSRLRTLHCFGCSESFVNDQIKTMLQRGRMPLIGITASKAVISLAIHATGSDAAEIDAMVNRDEQEIRHQLGALVFGADGDRLQDAVTRLLMERRLSVSTAESCTGGLLAGALTDVPGVSACFGQGWVTYSNAAKERELGVPAVLLAAHGAVSAETAQAMAEGCRRRARSDYTISVTGIAGPAGGSAEKPVGLVYVAIAGPMGTGSAEFRFGEHLSRAEIRDRAVKAALNLLRKKLLGVE